MEFIISFEETPVPTSSPTATPISSSEAVVPDYSEHLQTIESYQLTSNFLICIVIGVLAAALVFKL